MISSGTRARRSGSSGSALSVMNPMLCFASGFGFSEEANPESQIGEILRRHAIEAHVHQRVVTRLRDRQLQSERVRTRRGCGVLDLRHLNVAAAAGPCEPCGILPQDSAVKHAFEGTLRTEEVLDDGSSLEDLGIWKHSDGTPVGTGRTSAHSEFSGEGDCPDSADGASLTHMRAMNDAFERLSKALEAEVAD